MRRSFGFLLPVLLALLSAEASPAQGTRHLKVSFEVKGLRADSARKLEAALSGLDAVKECAVGAAKVVVVLADAKELAFSDLRRCVECVDPRTEDGKELLSIPRDKIVLDRMVRVEFDPTIEKEKLARALRSLSSIQNVFEVEGTTFDLVLRSPSALTLQSLETSVSSKLAFTGADLVRDVTWKGSTHDMSKSPGKASGGKGSEAGIPFGTGTRPTSPVPPIGGGGPGVGPTGTPVRP